MSATAGAAAAGIADPRELQAALERDVEGDVRFDAYSRHLYAQDASSYAIEPLGVCLPRHADDVAAAVAVGARLGVPVLARGGGTSLAGQCVALRARARPLAAHARDRRDRPGGAPRAGAAGRHPGAPQPRRRARTA